MIEIQQDYIMFGNTVIIKNIKTCVTMDPSLGKGPLGIVNNCYLKISQHKIVEIGPMSQLIEDGGILKDANHGMITPGLIDCHTHVMFAGSRSQEFFDRLQGKSYEQIIKQGGGICHTVKATQAASDKDLLNQTMERLDQFLKFGVTTVEAKSGYGLTVKDELRILRLLSKLDHTVEIIPTFLGAHIIPHEFENHRSAYVDQICNEMLPAVVKESLAMSCDVFCDACAFSVSETRRILETAQKVGLPVRLHADQLSNCSGAELAAEFHALSADHLEYVSDKGIKALAKKNVVAVLLPGAVFFLGKDHYANARKLIDQGVCVAISTDCNPGTCNTENLPMIMTISAIKLNMTCEEIWQGVTLHAAKAINLNDRGVIKPGAQADLAIWNVSNPQDVIYGFGSCCPEIVIKKGKWVERSCLSLSTA